MMIKCKPNKRRTEDSLERYYSEGKVECVGAVWLGGFYKL